MPIGFRCYNDSGTFQIDGVFKQFVLRRKVTMSTTEHYGSDIGDTRSSFTLNGDEIAALYSTSPCAIYSQTGTTALVVSTGAIGTSIEAFVFGPVTDIGTTRGLVVRRESDLAVVFDALQKILGMVGFPVGEGTFTYPSGRKYAVICMNQYLSIVTTLSNSAGFNNMRNEITRGLVRTSGSSVVIANIKHYDDFQVMDPSQFGFDESVTSNVPNRHIVIDVTNY